jgi:phosphoribosyl-AMP cyclohydrolase
MKELTAMIDLDFEKSRALVPAVLQDADTDAVLMVGFMDRQAFEQTLATRRATFFSRTRQRLWIKGETSGNFAEVAQVLTDCDRDALLLKVRVRGDGLICHKGTVSCFTHEIDPASGDSSTEAS